MVSLPELIWKGNDAEDRYQGGYDGFCIKRGTIRITGNGKGVC